MNTNIIGLLFFIVVPSSISLFLYTRKRKVELLEKCKCLFLYMLVFYSMISFIKVILGEAEYSICESFAENTALTYIHYAVPMFFLSIIVPVIHRWLKNVFGERLYLCESFFGVFYLSFLLRYIYDATIQNTNLYVSATAGAAAAVCIVSLIANISISIDYRRCTILLKIKKAAWIFLFYSVSAIFFIPNQIYLKNISEFHVGYLQFVALFGITAILFTLGSVLGSVFLLADKLFDYILCLVFGITICGYLQSNFLNGSMMQLDGVHQKWSTGAIITNLFVWVILVGAILVLKKRYPVKMMKIIGYISIYVVLIQMVTWGFLVVTTKWEKANNYVLNTDQMLTLDTRENVVVFILDWYDEQILERIVEKDTDFLEPFQGFTWYKNQTSKYSFTSMAIPYLLTGTEWERGTTEEEYSDYAYQQSDFLQRINKNGYEIGIYTEPQYVSDENHVIINYVDQNHRDCDYKKTTSLMKQCSQYQTVPFALKTEFWYQTSDLNGMVSKSNAFIGDNVGFYNSLISRGLNTENTGETGAFRFYHLYGVHDMNMTEDIAYGATDTFSEGRGVLKIVKEYLQQMKALDIYDSSTIIITADHGQNYLNTPERLKERDLELTSNPILLVKKSGENSGLRISNAPVSHANFFASVLESVGDKASQYGDSYDAIPENADVVREMIYYRTGDIPYVKYIINGNATDINSWSYTN